jgi:hypothetical protein
MSDVFRPRRNPARDIYDAFQEEAIKRKNRHHSLWTDRELHAVWVAARDHAQKHGLRVPFYEEIEVIDQAASGHVDYAAKLACNVARLLEKKP